VEYTFDWDPKKAALNLRKHGVSFERTATVLVDPRPISIPDEDHSEDEERWVTMGLDTSGTLLAVIHTFEELDAARSRTRSISGRKATRKESRQYAKVAQ
jgi:uncharacterized DUF497 family protein